MTRKIAQELVDFLSYHKQTCSIQFPNRGCNCGRHDALRQLEILQDAMSLIEKIDWWLEKEGSLSENSQAGLEIDEIIRRAKDERIISTQQDTG